MTLSECRIRLLMRRYDTSDTPVPTVRFSTVREFRAFQYELQVEYKRNDEERRVQLRIRGVHAPVNIMPSAGAAVCDIELEGASGVWQIELAGARQHDSLVVDFGEEGISIVQPPADPKIEVGIDEEVEIVRL